MPLTHTEREIDAIPRSVAKAIDCTADTKRVSAVLRNMNRIIFIGSGESHVIAKISAAYFNRHSSLHAEAIQSFEFLKNAHHQFDSRTTLVFLCSSGRMSPVVQGLSLAINAKATTVLITNELAAWSHSFSADYCLSTHAQKKGMPTQSTICSLVTLFKLIESIPIENELPAADFISEQSGLGSRLAATLSSLERPNIETITAQEYSGYSCLGTGYGAYIAETMSNLLSCGPMIEANHMPLEEYHHSLRLFMPQKNKAVFIFDDEQRLSEYVKRSINEILEQGAIIIFVHHCDLDDKLLISHNNLISIQYLAEQIVTYEQKALHMLAIAQKLSLLFAKKRVEHGLIRALF